MPKKVYIAKCREEKTKNKRKALERRKRLVGKKKQKKKPINWQELTINAVIDLIIGTILILIDKYLG